MSKYVGSLPFCIILVSLSVTNGSITVASIKSAIGARVKLIMSLIAIRFTLHNGFVKLCLTDFKIWKRKMHKMLAKKELHCVRSIVSKLIQEYYNFGEEYVFINKEIDRYNKSKQKEK